MKILGVVLAVFLFAFVVVTVSSSNSSSSAASASTGTTKPVGTSAFASGGSIDAKPISRWQISSSTNALDGKVTGRVGNDEMVIRCTGRKVEGYVNPPLTNLGHQLETSPEYTQSVRFRVDEGPLRSESWSVAKSFDALFIPARSLHSIAQGKSLTYEYHPEYVVKETTTVDLSGLSDALAKAGCKI